MADPSSIQQTYLAAAARLRALYGPPLVDTGEFAARANALLTTLVALGVPGVHLGALEKLRDETVMSAGGKPVFKAILGHVLHQLRGAGLLPLSHSEEPARVFSRLASLAEHDPPSADPETSRRPTQLADEPDPSSRATTLLRQARAAARPPPAAERDDERSDAPPPRLLTTRSPSGQRLAAPAPASGDAQRRFIVLEEPADSERLVPIKSNFKINPRAIGEGGAGKVYAGRDVDTGLRVAVKVVTIPDASKQAQYLELFQNEREIQGSIESDCIVRIYRTGLTGGAEPYLVMELLPGGSLADFIDDIGAGKRRFQLDEVEHIGAMAIAAVSDAHRRGIIHKDIKPENFLFSEDRRQLKLGDFGISERKDRLSHDINGTIGYVPVETFENALDNETRDVFALGVTLYLLFTGRMPFSTESAPRAYHDMCFRTPPAPGQIRPERRIPPEVDRILLRALSRAREERQPDAEAMLFEFVTAEVGAFLAEARALVADAAGDPNDPERLIREQIWSRKTREAVRRLDHIEERYPNERIRRWRLELLGTLLEHADRVGDEELHRETVDRVGFLDPGSELVSEAQLSVAIAFGFDDPGQLLKQRGVALSIVEMENRAGVFHHRSVEGAPPFLRTLEFPRGKVYGLGVWGGGAYPLFLPLPVRPGRHRVRVPIYAERDLPPGCVLVTAGRLPSRNRHGSYSEEIAPGDVRRVGHDFAISNLVSNADYAAFLEQLRRSGRGEEALERRPGRWVETRSGYVGEDGRPLPPGEPVRFLAHDDARVYLETMAPGARLPTMNEMKRASRGNDARVFPWGDAMAQKPSMAGFQFIGYPAASAPMASVPDDPMVADRSPFSAPDGLGRFRTAAYHLVGNLTEFLSLGATPEERAPILSAFAATRGLDPQDDNLDLEYFVTFGLPYNSPAPTNADIIGIEHSPREVERYRRRRFRCGFRWVIPLRGDANG